MHNVSKNSSQSAKLKDDAIVISGISGIYPNAENNMELCKNLYNKVDMVSKVSIPDTKHLELPIHYGKINSIERFDAQFFRVTPNQARSFEPVGRKVMEQAYSAMFDAGVNPETMKGTNLGVFVGFAQSDLHSSSVYNIFHNCPFVLSGTSKTMIANRISYWVDAKGPSLGIEVGCASSMACLQKACENILAGECDAALVCGISKNNHPILTMNMKSAGFLCLDGKTKCFDANGDGYVRSEAVTILFLQKAKDAKRVYAEICHVNGVYSINTNSPFLPIRNPKEVEKFFKDFYSEIDISPDDVEYIEANATGISEADRGELEGISKIFGKKHPIKIGSIKSNLGHTESASGIVGVIKMCLAYQKGELPANLHYSEPLDVPAVRQGKLQILTENTCFGRGYVALNNFSYTGASYHVLLKGHFTPKDINRYATNLPQLILVSGRHEEGVNKILEEIENNTIDPEQIALLRGIFKFNIPGHTGRGFGIFNSEDGKTVSISKSFEYYSGNRRSVCFMYSGLGSQWAGMSKELMNIPIFADVIQRCHEVLIPKGLDLVDVITNDNGDIVNNIMHSLIGITAVQIGLTDILTAIGITPDLIIGHSLGEIGCAYADGCFTAEEAILQSYYRSYVSAKTKFIKGKMAAVGLGYKNVQELSPPDIDIACHNSSNSTTISGPAEVVDKFTGELKELNIFAKIVPSSNIAFHSRYISQAGEKLRYLMKSSNTELKHSEKWLSTCYPPEKWENKASQFTSAEYFTHNLLNTVYFEEAAKRIPNDSIIIEIAPHGLMQAILNKSHGNCLNLPLMRRNNNENVKMMFEAIGKIYQNGINPDVSVLYPKVDLPVSTHTPELSHLVQWDHSVEWKGFENEGKKKRTAIYVEYMLSIYDDDYKFVKEYMRNGVNVYPESSLLVLVWKTMAMYKNMNYKELSVKFSDVKFYDDVIINRQEVLTMSVSIQKGSNKFEVTNQEKVIVNGTIQRINDHHFQNPYITIKADDLRLTKDEIYKLLSMQGFSYGPSLQSIEATNPSRNEAIVKWNGDWATFLDSIIQMNLLSEIDNTTRKLKFISSLYIHATKHIDSLITNDIDAKPYVVACRNTNFSGKTFCGGIVCESVVFEQITFPPSRSQIFTQEFVPHICDHPVNVSTAVHVNMQIVYENNPNDTLFVSFIKLRNENIFSKIIKDEISRIFSFQIKLKLIELNDVDNANHITKSDILVCPDVKDSKILKNVLDEQLKNNSFLMLMGDKEEIKKIVPYRNTELITRFKIHNLDVVMLVKRRETKFKENPTIVSNSDDLKYEIQNNDKDTILILNNISNFIPQSYKDISKVLLKQGKKICLVDVHKASDQTPVNNIFAKEQAVKNLALNVLRYNDWGGYYSIPFESNDITKNVKLRNNENDTGLKITNNNSVQVYFSSLYMKESKDVSIEIKKNCFGIDFSGIDSNGKRVLGCILDETTTSLVPIDPNLLWPVPEHWSLEDAATVPLTYLHAYYCLIIRHRLKSKSRVLVTEAASALGQAVISVCLSIDCTIFAIVNNEFEKTWVKRIFPQLNEKDIRLSIDLEFKDYVLNSTDNKRCDVVINSSSGELRLAAIACVGVFGHFLDLNVKDMKENEPLSLNYLKDEQSYISIRLASLFNDDAVTNKQKLQNAIAEGIAKGIVKPLLRVVFPRSVTSKSLMSTMCKKVCRMVNKIKDGNSIFQMFGELRIILNPNKVYIVIWDDSELGVEFINRLIERGAKYLIIHTRQESLTGYYLAKSLSWTSVEIEISNENLNSVPGCKKLVESGIKMGDIDGIYILHSDLDRNESTRGTVDLVESNLDITSRDIATLSYFVSLKFETNDVAKNKFAKPERYFMERQKLGLPSLQIVFKFNEMNYSLKYVSGILNGFERSLKCENYNVLVTDYEKFNKNDLKLTKEDIRAQVSEDKFKMFIDDINGNEYQGTEPIIYMKTLTSKYNEDEIRIDPDERNAIMISGFLGNFRKLWNVAERLKISAIGLQIPPDMDGSISQLAANLLQYIKLKFRIKSKFYIVAYSFGVNIALEVTVLLEKEGYHGIVFCLDSSPLALQQQIETHLGHLTEDELQNSIIQHTYTLLTGTSSQNLKETLAKCENWYKKIEAFINDIKQVSSYSHDYLKDVVNALYKRILLAKEYKPNIKLNSEIVLIKGLPDPKTDILPDDYDLFKFTSKPVKVINVTSNHVTNDVKISNIINGMLEPELLELFAKKNLCEVYFS